MHIIPISRVVAHWTEIRPDRVALVDEDEQLDWKALDQTSNQLARAYRTLAANEIGELGMCPASGPGSTYRYVGAPGGISEQELLNDRNDRLVRYKIPRTIECVSEPLRDDAGKSRRQAVAGRSIAIVASVDSVNWKQV